MKLIVISFLILLNVNNGMAQKCIDNFSLHFGLSQSNNYTKPFYTLYSIEGLEVYKQSQIVLLSFNLLFEKAIRDSKIIGVYGVGIGRKGFLENGVVYEIGPVGHEYTKKIKRTDMPIFLGIKCKITEYKRYKFFIGQFIIPELLGFNNDLYKIISVSTRINFPITYSLKKENKLIITPFFQTALSKYNSTRLFERGSDYWPYSYGITIGYSLKEKK